MPAHDCPVSTRTNDIDMTRQAVGFKVFASRELQHINKVRLAFQVVRISELVDASSFQLEQLFRSFSSNLNVDDCTWPVSEP